MKYAIILPDGAADEPVPALHSKTPLQVAQIPHIDEIARSGRVGRVVTVPEGFLPGSDVATMSLFGYDPRTHYDGRAPLEAAAKGIAIKPNQIVFRCNFVTIVEEVMRDFTAGHITQPEADRLITDLNRTLGGDRYTFHSGISYRNLMVADTEGEMDLTTTPPHDIPDQSIGDFQPKGASAEEVSKLMNDARTLLQAHEINAVRRDMGENPATDIWLWGQGRPTTFEPFESRYGLRGAVIAAVDLIRGIAVCAGLSVLHVPGATGYLDTNYAAKGSAAVAALDEYDVVVVHIEAPDEAGHMGDVRAKIRALEQIDKHVVAPILAKLKTFARWRILIAPDHPTPVLSRVHTATPPPFCMCGSGVHGIMRHTFCEDCANASDLFVGQGHELMEFLLHS